MPGFSLFRRNRDAKQTPSEKQAGKQKAQPANNQPQHADDPSQPEPPKPKYRHVPTHAASDALLGAPAGWMRDDAERVRENNRRRTAGDAAAAAAAAASASAALTASHFSTRQNSRKSLMLSPMHADNLNSMASTPVGGSSSSSSFGFGFGFEHDELREASSSSRSSRSSSSHGDKAEQHQQQQPQPGDAGPSAHATKRNTLANSYSYSNGHSNSSTSLRKSVHWSHSTGHLAASPGVGLVGPALHTGSNGMRFGTNTRSLDAEINRARRFPLASPAAATPPATLPITPAQAMPALALTPASPPRPGGGPVPPERSAARPAGPWRPSSTSGAFPLSEQMPPINAEALAFNAAGARPPVGSGGRSRRSSSVHSSSHRRASIASASASASASTAATRERPPSSAPSRPPVSSRSRLASISAYLKAPRAAPAAPLPPTPPAAAAPGAAAATPTAGSAGSGGGRSRSRSNASRRASHGGLGTVFAA